MTLDEARLNFGREVEYTQGLVTEYVELCGIWGQSVQVMQGYGHLKLVDPATLTLA